MKKLVVCIYLIYLNLDVYSQNILNFNELKFGNNKEINEESSKDLYSYKTHFYNAIKQKSLENYEKALKLFLTCIELNPNESASYLEVAKIYSGFDNNLSLEYAEKAYNLNRKNKWHALLYAERLIEVSDYSAAIIIYERLIKNNVTNEDYYLDLAKICLFDRQFYKAIDVYNNLENKIGINYFTSTQKHKIYLELKNYTKAAEELENYINKHPNQIEFYELLSDCYTLQGNFAKSLEVLIKISELDPNSGAIHLRIADYYLNRSDTSKYIEELLIAFSSKNLDVESKIRSILSLITPLYENDLKNLQRCYILSRSLVINHSEDVMSNYIYADILKIKGVRDTSVIYYKKVIDLDPSQQDAWREFLFLHLSFNNIDSLIKYSTLAIDLYPTNPIFYYLNAIGYYFNKDYKKSIETLEIGVNFVVRNNNLNSEMYSILGDSYNALKQFQKSDESYEKALEFLPNNVQVLNNYAYYLSLRGENLQKAKEMSFKTLEMFPEEASYCDTYAWILYKLKEYDKAKMWMEKAINLGESQTFYDHMSEILIKLGDLEQAEIYRKKSLDFNK